MGDELLPLNLPPLLASLLTQIGVKEAFRSLLSVMGLKTEAKAVQVIQEVKEITEGTLKEKVVMVIVSRDMKDPVLMTL